VPAGSLPLGHIAMFHTFGYMQLIMACIAFDGHCYASNLLDMQWLRLSSGGACKVFPHLCKLLNAPLHKAKAESECKNS
jgi:hypothetical protein